MWPGRFLEALDEAQARLRHTLAEAAREAGVAAGLAEGPSGPGREAAVEPLPFHGGWGLYLGYELAGQIEPSLRLPPFRGALPVAAALFCPAAVLRDRRSGRCFATALPGHEADHSAGSPRSSGPWRVTAGAMRVVGGRRSALP